MVKFEEKKEATKENSKGTEEPKELAGSDATEEVKRVASEVFESFGGFFKLKDCITATEENYCDIEDTVEQLIHDSLQKVILNLFTLQISYFIIIRTSYTREIKYSNQFAYH